MDLPPFFLIKTCVFSRRYRKWFSGAAPEHRGLRMAVQLPPVLPSAQPLPPKALELKVKATEQDWGDFF